MKHLKFTFTVIFLTIAITTSMAQKDEAIIKNVIEEGYVQGLHNQGDLNKTAANFHPGFNLLGMRNNMLTKYPIYSWIESSKNRREKPKDKREPKTTAKYPMIDITGNSAIAKVELYREEKKIFTDYLSLYKFDEGWRIVSKIYHDHR